MKQFTDGASADAMVCTTAALSARAATLRDQRECGIRRVGLKKAWRPTAKARYSASSAVRPKALVETTWPMVARCGRSRNSTTVAPTNTARDTTDARSKRRDFFNSIQDPCQPRRLGARPQYRDGGL